MCSPTSTGTLQRWSRTCRRVLCFSNLHYGVPTSTVNTTYCYCRYPSLQLLLLVRDSRVAAAAVVENHVLARVAHVYGASIGNHDEVRSRPRALVLNTHIAGCEPNHPSQLPANTHSLHVAYVAPTITGR